MISMSCTNNYDFVIDINGSVELVKNSDSLCSRLYFEITSNKDWVLSKTFGMDYINKRENGILQTKEWNVLFYNEINRIIKKYSEITSVDKIEFQINKRKLSVHLEFKTIFSKENIELNILM